MCLDFNSYILKIRYILLILICCISLVGCVIENKNYVDIENSSDNYEQNLMNETGYISFGVLEKGSIVDNLSVINSDIVNHTISISQNLTTSRDYLFLVLLDYKQVEFTSDGETAISKLVHLNPQDTLEFDIEFLPNENDSELTYIFLKAPKSVAKIGDIDVANSMSEILALRYYLTDNIEQDFTTENTKLYSTKPIADIFLSKDPDELKVLYECDPSRDLFLTIGNISSSDNMIIPVIKLVDGKQELIDEEYVKFYRIKSKHKINILVNHSDIEEGSIIQYVSFPLQLDSEGKLKLKRYVNSSIRTVVK